MLKAGIIGFGKMGQIRANALEKSKRAHVLSIYEPTDVKTNYKKAASADEIISNPEIEMVFVCTPNYMNKELTIKSLLAGKHVFCEKPPAFTAADVEEIKKAEAKAGKKLMYGLNHRHHDSIKEMKKMIDSGSYGKILWMRGRYGKSVDKSFFDNWRAKKDLTGGGIMIDQGIHMLDLFLYLADDFDDIHAFVSNLYWKIPEVEDNVFAIFRNSKTGVVASLHSTMTQWRHLFSIEVFLEKGYMVLNGLKTSSNSYGDEILTVAKNRSTAPAATWEDEEQIQFHTDNSWDSEIDYFLNSVEKNIPVSIGNSQDASKLMKIIDRIYENK